MTAVHDPLDTLLGSLVPPLGRFDGAAAAPARTLVDVLMDTAARHPYAAAIDSATDSATGTLTYLELLTAVGELAQKLTAEGVGAGDRVGVRVPSGTADLYVAILAVLAAGAAYVPVD